MSAAAWDGIAMADALRAFNGYLMIHPQLQAVVLPFGDGLGVATKTKPLIIEMGGKNPAIITSTADLDKATDGVMRSAFGAQGQKCSACSRVYVSKDVRDTFVALLRLLRRLRASRKRTAEQRDRDEEHCREEAAQGHCVRPA